MGALCSQDDSTAVTTTDDDVTSKVWIHGLPISANAMGPVLLVTHIGCGELKMCDLMKGQNRADEFLIMNPFHTIPTMESSPDVYCLGESQAMMRYIARMFAPDLYPDKDAKLAARTDWAMDALGTTFSSAFTNVAYPVMGFPCSPPDEKTVRDKMKEVLDMFCSTFLDKSGFICGEQLTIADFKALPMFFILAHPAVQKKTGVKLSARVEKYVADLKDKIVSSHMLDALKAYLDPKAEGLPDAKDVVVCGEGSCPPMKTGAAKANENAAKVWGMTVSGNAASVVMLAKDAGIGDLEQVNLLKGEHLKPDFIAKNPFHQIPTFEGSDGFCLGESNAALRYIATHYKTEFYPVDIQERGRVDWAMDVVATSIYKTLGLGVYYSVLGFAPAPKDQKAANEAATAVLAEFESAFLQGRSSFVCGQKITIAEYKIAPFLFTADHPVVFEKTGFRLSDRMRTYLELIMDSLMSAEYLTEDESSLQAYLASKK